MSVVSINGRDIGEIKDLMMKALPQKYLTKRMLGFLTEAGVIDMLSETERHSYESLMEALQSNFGVESLGACRIRMFQIIVDFLVECNLIEVNDGLYSRGSKGISDYELEDDEIEKISKLYYGQLLFFNKCIDHAMTFIKGGPPLLGFNEKSLDVWESFLGNAEYKMARELLIKLLTSVKSGKCKVLNLCYGPGFDIMAIEKLMPESEITAIDYSDVFRERACRRISRPESTKWTDSSLWNGFGHALPFDEEVFDIVFFACADPYIPEEIREAVYRDIYRVMKKGGSLGVLTNSYPDAEKSYVKNEWIRRGVLCHDFAESMCEGWKGFVRAENSIDMFEKSGFSVGSVLLNASLWRLDKL